MSIGILSFGGYVPRARLSRKSIVEANGWFNSGLKSLGKGERAMANWDEDSVTMAVEAARDCLAGFDRDGLSAVYMASTSFPFRDRQNSGIVAEALNLPRGIQTLDLASSQRAGSSGLSVALRAAAGSDGPILFAAGEKRRTKAASPLELTTGDGAAALLVGEGDVVAKFIGGYTEAVDFVDHYRGQDEAFDYMWEERWIRDEGYMKIVPTAVAALLEKTGVKAEEIDRFCFPAAARRVAGTLAKKLGLSEESVADNLQAACGETGTAHPLVMLVHALEQAKPGEKILATGFGQGCDALLFETTEALASLPARTGIGGFLARRREETNYNKFLAFNDLVTIEQGLRSEVDKQTGLTTLYRNREMVLGMVGGKCTKCGTQQFPKSNVCVNPNCNEVGSQEDQPFSDMKGRLNSFTADRLTYCPDPPNYFGMIQFEKGGRLMSDFTDIDPDNDDLQVGMPMRMTFRVKDYDTKRGFRRYFWKATPAETGAAATGD